MTKSDDIYRRLLAFYPAEFRYEYGDEMVQLFLARRMDEGAFHAWLHVLPDLVATAAGQHLETLWRDIRYSLRALRKSPVFTAVAVLALALGIGANTAIFSIVKVVLLRPFSLPDPEQLVRIRETDPGAVIDRPAVAYPNFLDWKQQNSSFQHVAAFRPAALNLTGIEAPVRLTGYRVTADFFPALKVAPLPGRAFTPEDDKPGAPPAVVLSHSCWRDRFGSDRSVLGKSIRLGGQSHEVIGVLPAEFDLMPDAEIWLPLPLDSQKAARGQHFLSAVGRLKPGVTIGRAQLEMNTISRRLAQAYPDTNANHGVFVESLRDSILPSARRALLVLLGAAGLVLLIACANVANLLLSRAAVRRTEIAIRSSIGAGRGRIIRQLLTESVTLAGLGGACGVFMGYCGLAGLTALIGDLSPHMEKVRLDASVLCFSFGLSALSGLIFGLVPALQISSINSSVWLREGARRSGGGRHGRRLRGLLVAAEMALASMLLIGAGLLVKSFIGLRNMDPGFRPEGILTMKLTLSEARYRSDTQKAAFLGRVVEQVSLLPGVESAALAVSVPTENRGGWDNIVSIEGRPALPPGQSHTTVNYLPVSPGFYHTFSIRLLAGRGFSERDRQDSPPVAIVSETFARKHLPGEAAIGKRLKFGDTSSREPWVTIVGVVNDVHHRGLDADVRDDLYVPVAQGPMGTMTLAVRAQTEPIALAAAVRKQINQIDPDQPVYQIRTMEQMVDRSIAVRRVSMILLSVFAGVSLVLSVAGIYGVTSYSVAQRTHEIGIRMALGAKRSDVVRLVVAQGMLFAFAGIAIGIAGAYGATGALKSLLHGVSSTDAITFCLISGLLAAVALLACSVPARRAARLDPSTALRLE